MSNNKRLKPKSKEYIQEAVDIIMNTEDDDAALAFLKDTLEDDFPDLELGTMDLHEAIKVLDGEEKKKSGNRKAIESLNESLGDFLQSQQKNIKKKSVRKTKKRKK